MRSASKTRKRTNSSKGGGYTPVITDTYVTARNVSDYALYLERLENQVEKFQFSVEAVTLDTCYFTSYICKKVTEKKIFMIMGYRRFGSLKRDMSKRSFKYVQEKDVFVCPMGCMLYSFTECSGERLYKAEK